MWSAFAAINAARHVQEDDDAPMHEEGPGREQRRGEPGQAREEKEKEDPNSLENMNKRGIYVPGEQTFDEFLATQSAAYKTRYANLAALEAHTRGLAVGTDEYNAAMAAYRKQALALARLGADERREAARRAEPVDEVVQGTREERQAADVLRADVVRGRPARQHGAAPARAAREHVQLWPDARAGPTWSVWRTRTRRRFRRASSFIRSAWAATRPESRICSRRWARR
jgi:hypothetical protein